MTNIPITGVVLDNIHFPISLSGIFIFDFVFPSPVLLLLLLTPPIIYPLTIYPHTTYSNITYPYLLSYTNTTYSNTTYHSIHILPVDLEMCFAPQRRALFQHLNLQKWSEHGLFCTFWLGNMLPATTACNFSSLIWPAGSAPAALASLLFDPPEPQIIGKTQCFATFLPFRASASSFFWLFLFYSSLF